MEALVLIKKNDTLVDSLVFVHIHCVADIEAEGLGIRHGIILVGLRLSTVAHVYIHS